MAGRHPSLPESFRRKIGGRKTSITPQFELELRASSVHSRHIRQSAARPTSTPPRSWRALFRFYSSSLGMLALTVRCDDGMDFALDWIGVEVPSRIQF